MTLSPDVVGTMIAAAWFLATRLGRIERKIDEAVVRLNTHEEAIGVLIGVGSNGFPNQAMTETVKSSDKR